MLKTYHGSCHCGAIKYEADIDFSQGTSKCSCSICYKLRWWGTRVRPAAFRLISPSSATSDVLTDYIMNHPDAHQLFCKKCGIHVFHPKNLPQIGGDFVYLNIACIDNLKPSEAVQIPVTYYDGRNNNYANEPIEKSYL
jgi:hypothetical protein